jgi:hypothetical protein
MIKKLLQGKGLYFLFGAVALVALILEIVKPVKTQQEISDNIEKFVTDGQALITLSPAPANQAAATTTVTESSFGTSTAATEEWPASGAPVTEPVIISPRPGATVSSPLIVKGQAPASCFTQSVITVKLLDAAGNLIAKSEGLSAGDSLTDATVPFSALLEFETTATSGSLLAGDNSSSAVPVLFLTK